MIPIFFTGYTMPLAIHASCDVTDEVEFESQEVQP